MHYRNAVNPPKRTYEFMTDIFSSFYFKLEHKFDVDLLCNYSPWVKMLINFLMKGKGEALVTLTGQ